MNKTFKTKLLIVGGGPAGLSAALYGARAELEPIVLVGPSWGGQMVLTDHIENYPGFAEGIGGQDLFDSFQSQALRFGAALHEDTLRELLISKTPDSTPCFLVKGENDNWYEAESLILATGASPRRLHVPGEKEFLGRGVSFCATCDGFFFRNKLVTVVGGGDSALEEALFLTRFAKQVNIIHRRDSFRASAILQRRAMSHEKIQITWDTVVESIEGNTGVEKLVLRNLATQVVEEKATDGVFIFIGHTPNTAYASNLLALDENGYIQINARYETSVKGIFAAGEAADPRYRQVIVSAGMGAAAAIEATHYLENLHNADQ